MACGIVEIVEKPTPDWQKYLLVAAGAASLVAIAYGIKKARERR
jgi:hypothetical protein